MTDPDADSDPSQAMYRPVRKVTVDGRRLSPSLVGLLDRGFIWNCVRLKEGGPPDGETAERPATLKRHRSFEGGRYTPVVYPSTWEKYQGFNRLRRIE
jgi:hypothetical protein